MACPHLSSNQISGRRKAKTKLPLYYNSQNILYPPGINLEQSSSEDTAAFKATILKSVLGEHQTIADLTGGFGIDSLILSRVFKKVHCVEPNNTLLQFVAHNHRTLGATHVQHHHTTAEKFLHEHPEKT